MFYSSFYWAYSYINACSGYRVNEPRVAGRYNFSTPSIIIGGFLIGLIIAFMSAAVPAYQALRLKVVDALREG